MLINKNVLNIKTCKLKRKERKSGVYFIVDIIYNKEHCNIIISFYKN